MTHDGRRRVILAIDTATTRVVIATGSVDGVADGISTWEAGYRHGETLLPAIGGFLGEQNIRRSRVAGIVVGTGPGAFTGLRVGIATAKGLAHGLDIPLVGVSTAEALIAAAEASGAAGDAQKTVLLMPAGPADRILVRPGVAPRLLPGGTEPDLAVGEVLVAIDLDGRAPADALARGEAARAELGPALLRAGAILLRGLAAADASIGDASRTGAGTARREALAALVPEYVTLPRGTRAASGSIAWSRDPR
jgi:hypothetical protein